MTETKDQPSPKPPVPVNPSTPGIQPGNRPAGKSAGGGRTETR